MVDRDESMVIRPATVADAEVVARLGAETFMETFGHLYTPQDLAAFLAASRTASFYRHWLTTEYQRRSTLDMITSGVFLTWIILMWWMP